MDIESSSQFGDDDLVHGCIMGAFCGDALGADLEFSEEINGPAIEKALEMPRGGVFKLGPGQVTGNSELALCLGHGLIAGEGYLNLEKIAQQYKS